MTRARRASSRVGWETAVSETNFSFVLRHGFSDLASPLSAGHDADLVAHLIHVGLPTISLLESLKGDGLNLSIPIQFSAAILAGWSRVETIQKTHDQLERSLLDLQAQIRGQDCHLVRETLTQEIARTEAARTILQKTNHDVIGALTERICSRQIEPLVGPFTHVSLSDHRNDAGAVRTQIELASKRFKELTGQVASGIVLTEAGYVPGMDQMLVDHGFRYGLVHQSTFDGSSAALQRGPYAPVHSPVDRFALFAEQRNFLRWGAPNGTRFLGLYRQRDELRSRGWLHTCRASSDIALSPYCVNESNEAIGQHVDALIAARVSEANRVRSRLDRSPLILGSLDISWAMNHWYELFPFVEALLRKVNAMDGVNLISPTAYLGSFTSNQVSWLGASENLGEVNDHFLGRAPDLQDAADRIEGIQRAVDSLSSRDRETLEEAKIDLAWAQASARATANPGEAALAYRAHLERILRGIVPLEARVPLESRQAPIRATPKPKPAQILSPSAGFDPTIIT